jgi:prophage antirepressor-like protein
MEIMPFNYENKTIRAFTDKRGNVWFSIKDLAKVLELSNSSQTTVAKLQQIYEKNIKILI